jgi:hypothetical protein
MDDEASIVWSVLFGAIGTGYLIYGRRQRKLVPFISGLALIGVPYFIDGTGVMVAVCVAFMALPYFLQL